MADDQDLYDAENESTKDRADDAEAEERQRISDAGARANVVGLGKQNEKGLQRGIRGRLRTRRSRAILGLAGVGGMGGFLLGGSLFFGPIIGLTDVVKSVSDHGFEPTDIVRAKRQARLFSDFMEEGRKGVYEGRRVGRYLGPIQKKWRNFKMGRFDKKARAAGWVIEYRTDVFDINGNPINPDGKKVVPTRMYKPGTDLDFDFTQGEGPGVRLRQLTNVDELNELYRTINNMLENIYPGRILGAVKRAHTRGFVNAITGFRWGQFFSKNAGSALARAYSSVFDPDGRYRNDDDFRLQDPDNPDNPNNVLEPQVDPDGNVVEFDTSTVPDLNEGKQRFFDRIKAGLSPRVAITSISTKFLAKFRSSLSRASIIVGLASIACLAKDLSRSDVEAAWNRYSSLLSYSSFMLGVAGEILNGGFNTILEDVGDLYHEFIAYEKIIVDDEGNWIEISKTVGQAAAVQRANGQEVIDGEELRATDYLRPNGNAIYQMFVALGDAIGWAVPSGICGALNSFWGGLLDFALGVGECFFTAFVKCAATEVAQELLFAIWGDDLMQWALGIATGNDLGIVPFGPPGSANILAQGISVMDSEQSRSGMPILNEQYNTIVAQYQEQKKQDIRELPFMERYFAVSTPGSLANKFAYWKTEAIQKSIVENIASVVKLPFRALANLFSAPAKAQSDTGCFSPTDPRVIEQGGGCIPFDNYDQQKYSYDANIECNGKIVNLLDGVNVENDNDDGYGPDWVEEQVLLILQGGSAEDEDGNTLTVECDKFNDLEETATKIAEICHGMTFVNDEVVLDPGQRYGLYSDPGVYGTGDAKDRNKDVRTYCMISSSEDDRIDYDAGEGPASIYWVEDVNQDGEPDRDDEFNYDLLELFALIGRYVDDLQQQDGMILLGGGFEDEEAAAP
jgi:hypothetical protein